MSDRNLHMLPLGPKEEKILIKQLGKGAPEAFKLLHHHFAGRVLGLTRQLLRDAAGAEDAAQETFIRVFRSIHKFRGDCRLATWIHRIATNVCLTELKKTRRRSAWEAERSFADDRRDVARGETPRREIALTQQRKQVTFYLSHVEGLSASEIATVLGEKRGTVLKRLQRTRLELLEMWQEAAGQSRGEGQSERGKS
jgi:RNA polymerase sigma-70 factor (ECF subfamily)